MKVEINGCAVVNDFIRRKIRPDYKLDVDQGELYLWVFNGSYIGVLNISGTKYLSQKAYINTYSHQEIADDIYKTAINL